MGRTYRGRRLCLSAHRLSKRKSSVLKRRRLREMREKLANNPGVTLFTENPTNSNESQTYNVQLLPNNILNANIENEIHCFDEIKEEIKECSMNNEEFETYEEKGVYNINIKDVEDDKDGKTITERNNCLTNEEFETHEEKDVFNLSTRHVEDNKNGKTVTERNNCLMDMSVQEMIFQGRCIIDISFVWSEIYRVFNKHLQKTKCQFKDWKLVQTLRHGLLTQFFFKCRMCNHEASIWSERVQPETLDINELAVDGTLKTGIGFSELNNLCTGMNIACMSEKSYKKIRKKLLNNCNKTAAVQNKKQESV